MDNLRKLLRDVLVIANYRYNGDLEISKEDKTWSVRFTEKIKNETGFRIVKAGEGLTLEEALEKTYKAEFDKARGELGKAKAFIKVLSGEEG